MSKKAQTSGPLYVCGRWPITDMSDNEYLNTTRWETGCCCWLLYNNKTRLGRPMPVLGQEEQRDGSISRVTFARTVPGQRNPLSFGDSRERVQRLRIPDTAQTRKLERHKLHREQVPSSPNLGESTIGGFVSKEGRLTQGLLRLAARARQKICPAVSTSLRHTEMRTCPQEAQYNSTIAVDCQGPMCEEQEATMESEASEGTKREQGVASTVAHQLSQAIIPATEVPSCVHLR
ncbi:hypothetical protein PENSPDRAFT_86122 [Peniophora sp. CONT]|nr:hypothetical protein PENSPDRAFT_86122 [Peniophora sp. CONT]